ncbi:MAG TPA: MEKHLA domain-containing protein [Roseimicrobium sp.]|nr:MEKHLA domain-containing protein [Roseimicrobium sp.]
MAFPQVSDAFVDHSECIVRSYKHWTGRDLLPVTPSDKYALAKALFEAPFVVASHGTETDPVLNYGNRAALTVWEMAWEEFTQTPSRYTAEPPNREERAALLARVTQFGFIDNYAGIRISKTGRRFRIRQAVVWNLITVEGIPCGQAATFSEWEYLGS